MGEHRRKAGGRSVFSTECKQRWSSGILTARPPSSLSRELSEFGASNDLSKGPSTASQYHASSAAVGHRRRAPEGAPAPPKAGRKVARVCPFGQRPPL